MPIFAFISCRRASIGAFLISRFSDSFRLDVMVMILIISVRRYQVFCVVSSLRLITKENVIGNNNVVFWS